LNKFAKNSEYIYKHLTNLNLHINNIAEFVSLNLLIIIVVINGAEIITRTWLPGSLYWVFELNQLFGNWLYFIGITLVYYRNDDISIDFLTNKLSFKLRMIVLFVLIVISYYCVDLMILQSQARTVGLGITNHYFSLPVFISSVLMILYMFEHILVLYINTNVNLGK
jgi:TRAP-type C4-dicarboxylate transport system permease small subunit